MTTVADCLRAVEERYGITELDMMSARTDRRVARPRQIVMWLARHATLHSLPHIGRTLRRDHTTIMHGVRTIDSLRDRHDGIKAITDELLHKLLH